MISILKTLIVERLLFGKITLENYFIPGKVPEMSAIYSSIA